MIRVTPVTREIQEKTVPPDETELTVKTAHPVKTVLTAKMAKTEQRPGLKLGTITFGTSPMTAVKAGLPSE